MKKMSHYARNGLKISCNRYYKVMETNLKLLVHHIYDNSYILMFRREGQQCLQTAVQHCEGSVVVWIYISAKTDGVMNTKK